MSSAVTSGLVPPDLQFPEHYHLPPFFTVQPVLSTRTKQFRLWVDWCLSYKFQCYQYLLSQSATIQQTYASTINIIRVIQDQTTPLFTNNTCKRKLSPDAIRLVLDELCREGYGWWESEHKQVCIMSWKTTQQWAQQLQAWASADQLHGNVYTLYEITAGDMSRGTEFRLVDVRILYRALQLLQEQRRVVLIAGDTLAETGIKFIDKQHP